MSSKEKSEEVNKKVKNELDADLVLLLNSKKVHLVPINEKSTRRKIVDWDEELELCCDRGWSTVKMIQDDVLQFYPKKKNIYYSEVLRFIRLCNKHEDIHLTKKSIPSGEHKGVYYKFEMK